jgi:hypothetical protein
LAKAHAYTIVNYLLLSWDFTNLNLGLSNFEIHLDKGNGEEGLDTVIDSFGQVWHLRKNKDWVLYSSIRLYF